MTYEHVLTGCKPEPLASYLKALAVFRLVSEQADSGARGYWSDEAFVLRTCLSRDDLMNFFVRDYAPTPLVAPWNNGSGFYHKDNKEGIEGIAKSETPRFEPFREVIIKIRSTESLKKESEEDKAGVQAKLRAELPDTVLAWIDSAFTFVNDNNVKYNSVLGTGGNEGRLDYTNNYMQRLVELLIKEGESKRQEYLLHSLFDTVVNDLKKASIGQFDPGRAGGFNQGCEIETKGFKINPWDFILMLEGTLLLTSSVYKRNDVSSFGSAAFPFVVSCSGVGYASSAQTENGRSELWLPLWKSEASLAEIRHVFAEGRCMVKQRKAKTGIDFSRAVSSLGVDRGLTSFTRYSFLERRGQNYVALPAGRVPVSYNPKVHLLDDMDSILNRVDGFFRQFENVPAAFISPRRRIDEAMYECAIRGDKTAFMRLVCALGQLENLIAQRDRNKDPKLSRPLSGLRLEWITQCGSSRPEVRIAAALASIHATEKVGGIRSNMSGVDPSAPWNWATGKSQQCWSGNNLIDRLSGVLSQRIMDASRLNTRPVAPLNSRIKVSSRDITTFLMGATNDNLLEDLLWGFTLVDWKKGDFDQLTQKWFREPLNRCMPVPRPYAMIRLLYTGGEVRKKKVTMEPRILPLLRAGRTKEAVSLAKKRLRFSDLAPLSMEDSGWVESKRLLAGLLIPVSDIKYLEKLALGANDTTKIEGEKHV